MPAIPRPRRSNALYRGNLAKGKTGLSVAFDCRRRPVTDSDHVTCARRGGSRSACRSATWATCGRSSTRIPLEQMNTSMTINATAPWLLSLYMRWPKNGRGYRAASGHGPERPDEGNTFSRGTYICPPKPSLAMTRMSPEYCTECPEWNRMNVCSYHLQEAGATPEAENWPLHLPRPVAVLDELRPRVPEEDFPVLGRPDFLFRECRHPLRHRDVQDARLRRPVGRDLRNGVIASPDPKYRRFRYGCRSIPLA